MNRTKIEYGTHAWNPVTGCSYGCPWGCWAEDVFTRHAAVKAYHGGHDFREVRLHPGRLDEPMLRKKPARILVSFMGDLFGPEVPLPFFCQVVERAACAPHHQFLLLTKRHERMADALAMSRRFTPTPGNLWLGVTVTTQAEADERIPLLLATPAAKRWVSIEPMLGPVKLNKLFRVGPHTEAYGLSRTMVGGQKYQAVDFVVVGSIDRPSPQFPAPKREWIESIREQCRAADVPLWEKNNLARHGVVKDRPLVQELPA